MKQIITCRNFVDEIEQATEGNYEYYYHYPLCLDNSQLSGDPIQKVIDKHKLDDYHVICCGLCEKTHKNVDSDVSSVALCFYQVLNPETVNYFMKEGNYIVTPGWLKNWKTYVEDDWAFTKEIAQKFFSDSFKRILVLDTGTSENIIEDTKDFAYYINKPYDILPVGLDYYKKYIAQAIKDDVKEQTEVENKKIKNQLVNYTTSVELIKNMSAFTNEEEILSRIFDILRMMFLPQSICFIPYNKGKFDVSNCDEDTFAEMQDFILKNDQIVYWLQDQKGFASKVFYGDQMIGILVLDNIFLPEYKEVYYNTYMSISNVIALALYNSRLYEQVLSVSKDYQQQKSYFEQLFKNSPEMILITSNDNVVQNTNESFNQYFGSNKKIIGKDIESFLKRYSENYTELLLSTEITYPKPIIDFKLARNGIRHIEFSKYAIHVFQETAGYYYILNDVTDRVEMEDKLRNMAFNDSLTGLYNRAYCDEEMSRLSQNRQLPLGIIIGDVNGLKITNDAFGHIAGDKILKQIAEILTTSCRKGDIISRWGGDEFVIILPLTDFDTVASIASRITEKCENFTGFDYVLPSISIGYAILDSDQRTITQTFIEAENMMYENKLLQKTSIRSRIVSSLETSLYEKSYETEEHAQRVSVMCLEVANHLGFDKQQLSEMELFARLHDIGKLLIDNALLEKPEPLTEIERKMIQEHSESGYRIANSISELSHISNFILHHHERWDGTGYPNKIKSYQIPIQSRILTIADSIDAMYSERPYKKGYNTDKVIRELLINKGRQFDPTLVDIFIDLFFREK